MTVKTESLTQFAWLSIGASIVTILLKTIAWKMTGSIGLLSDAIESLVNLASGVMALWMLTISNKPADDDHAHGHGKAEYFSSAFEGILILVAAISIGYTAIIRLFNPQPLEEIGIGIMVSIAASIVNFIVSKKLMNAGKKHNSITLEADAQHLMTDVWTSIGVIAAVILVYITGWLWLDAIIALVVAINIIWTGYTLIKRSTSGLMDSSLPTDKLNLVIDLLNSYKIYNIQFNSLRTRQSGAHVFVTINILVPGQWSVQIGHDWAEKIEKEIELLIMNADVTTHLEPIVN